MSRLRSRWWFRFVSVVVAMTVGLTASSEGLRLAGVGAWNWLSAVAQGEPPEFNETPETPTPFSNGRSESRDGIWNSATLEELGSLETAIQSQLDATCPLPATAPQNFLMDPPLRPPARYGHLARSWVNQQLRKPRRLQTETPTADHPFPGRQASRAADRTPSIQSSTPTLATSTCGCRCSLGR